MPGYIPLRADRSQSPDRQSSAPPQARAIHYATTTFPHLRQQKGMMQETRSLGLTTMVLALAMAVGPARGQTVPPQAGWSDRVPRVEGARHHFVGAEGKAGNPGTKEAPWDLPSALAGRAEVKPGDVVWVRGGT